MHADRTNRALLILLALLLLAVGLDAGAASIGVYGTATQNSTLMDNPTGALLRRARCLAMAGRRGGRADHRAARAALADRAALLHRPLG